jgi:gliding motility-associated lipoprotein GldH
MNRALNYFLFSALAAMLLVSACTDPKAVIDQNTPVVNQNWSYLNKFSYDVKIDDASKTYNLYLNLRVTSDYKYSNLFVLINQTGPDKKAAVTRYEFKLANADGEWLGKGSGNLYAYQLPFKTNYKFPTAGIYHFYIEQNMRDNPLREVSDVGMRVATP